MLFRVPYQSVLLQGRVAFVALLSSRQTILDHLQTSWLAFWGHSAMSSDSGNMSINILHRVGLSGDPCATPLSTVKHSSPAS